MEHDDTPRIAVLDANPIGLEAALYARYLGYVVHIFDQDGVCAALKKQGGENIEGPFRENCSPLGLAALDAHDSDYQTPALTDVLTVRQWLDRYVVPLSHTDLIADFLRLQTTIADIQYMDDDEIFSIQVRDGAGVDRREFVDYVVDTRAQACVGCTVSPQSAPPPSFSAGLEDDFMRISAKTFLACLDEIQRIFAKVGERDDLDIYASLKRFEQ